MSASGIEFGQFNGPVEPETGDIIVGLRNNLNYQFEYNAGAETGTALVNTITQTAHGFLVGDVVYFNGAQYTLAKADTAADAEVIGIVSTVVDVNDFDLLTSGYITTLSGLIPGSVYFLSDSIAGALSTTEPSTPGHISKPLLIAVLNTTGFFFNWRGKIVPSESLNTLTYVTNTDETAILPSSQPLSALATGIMQVTTATGIVSSLPIPLVVANGGTGIATTTAYAVICGGTTATGAFQHVSGLGTSGYVLTSNGAAALPTWQAPAGDVTSIAGTANEITASASTGAITLSIPSTFIAPGTAAAVTSMSTRAYLLTGSGSGTISILPQAAAGTYNFNLPITAGTSGYVLTSAGGAGSPMTWTNPSSVGAVSSVTGTASQIDVSPTTGNCVVSIDSGYVGQTSITTVGALAAGSLASGFTPVTVPLGGTGNTTFTAYAVICAGTSATGAFQNVSGLGTAGQVLTSNGAGALPTWGGGGSGTGIIAQVQTATLTGTFSTTSTTYTTVTGLSVSITPSSSSSKIFIVVSLSSAGTTNSDQYYVQLARGSTGICVGASAGSRFQVSFCNPGISSSSNSTTYAGGMNFVDSPATTSSTTYNVQIAALSGDTAYVNFTAQDTNAASFPRCASTITVMEIL